MFFVYIIAIVILVSLVWMYILSFEFWTNFDRYYVDYYQSYFINEKNFSLTPYFYKIFNYNGKWYNDLTWDFIDDDYNEDNIYCYKAFSGGLVDDDCFFRWEYGLLPPATWISLWKFDSIQWSWLIFYFTWQSATINLLVKYQNLDTRQIRYFLITWNSIREHYFEGNSFSLSIKNLNKNSRVFYNIYLSWNEGLKEIQYLWNWKWVIKKKFNIFPGNIPLFFYDILMKTYIYETPTNPVFLKIYTWDFDGTNIGIDSCQASWYNDVKLEWYRYPQFRYVNGVKYINTDYFNQLYFDVVVINENGGWKKEKTNLPLKDYCVMDSSERYKCVLKNIDGLNNLFTGIYLFKINLYRVLSWWIIYDQQWSYLITWHINYCP